MLYLNDTADTRSCIGSILKEELLQSGHGTVSFATWMYVQSGSHLGLENETRGSRLRADGRSTLFRWCHLDAMTFDVDFPPLALEGCGPT